MENRSRPRIRYTCKIRSVQEVSLGTPLTCIVALLTVAKGNNLMMPSQLHYYPYPYKRCTGVGRYILRDVVNRLWLLLPRYVKETGKSDKRREMSISNKTIPK